MADQRLDILYADEHLVVVEKPGGLLAVPGRGPDKQDCVTNRIKKIFPGCIAQPAVHRLDMATSGLMVLALTTAAHRHLSRQFADRLVKKRYEALLEGRVSEEKGEISLAFRLDPANRPWQIYDPVHGKMGITRWQRLEISAATTRVSLTPLTGRTHQLRLHAAHELGLGCPVIGDSLYGSGREGDPMLLHATFLSFVHPDSSSRLEWKSSAGF